MSRITTCLVIAAVAFPARAIADAPLFPTPDGWTWYYQNASGGSQTAEISGSLPVIGNVVSVRDVQVDVSAGPDHHENYWSDDGSDVFLHGFTQFSGGFSRTYSPPVLWIDEPLFVGKTWSTTIQAYSDLNGQMPSGTPFTVQLSVTDSQTIDVPAGSFAAYEITQTLTPTGTPVHAIGRDLLGRTVGAAAGGGAPSQWLAVNVGIVRESGSVSGPFDLVAFGNAVSVEGSSWARIKALYGDAPR